VRSSFFPLCWSGRGRWPDTITSHVLVLCTHDTLLPLYAPTHCSVPSTASVIESSSFPQWQAHARAGARPCLYITHSLFFPITSLSQQVTGSDSGYYLARPLAQPRPARSLADRQLPSPDWLLALSACCHSGRPATLQNEPTYHISIGWVYINA
jgi:hypothetical protein